MLLITQKCFWRVVDVKGGTHCHETVRREEVPEGKRDTVFPSSLAKRAEEQTKQTFRGIFHSF